VRAARESRNTHMRQRVWKIVEYNRRENPEWEKWFKSVIGGSWALRKEWMECIGGAQRDGEAWNKFERWLVNRFKRWHQTRGQKRIMWDTIMKQLKLSKQAESEVMDELLGWTYEDEAPANFAKHIRKHLHSGPLSAGRCRWRRRSGCCCAPGPGGDPKR
jgi:hypothetical protein